MKKRIFPRLPLAIAGFTALALSAMSGAAQSTSPSANAPGDSQTAAPGQTNPVKLSYGVPDVLNLSRAHVSDDTIVAFIGGSGTIYSLDASEIIYLRGQGVSDRVINTMLNQRTKATETAAQVAARAQTASAASQWNNADANSAAYTQPPATYVETAPSYVPASTVYVIPNSPPTYVDYGYYPYYGGYYGSWFPPVSFSFGFGNYYRGGYHGGGYGGFGGSVIRGGGFRGGGFRGGGGGGFHVGGFHGGGRR